MECYVVHMSKSNYLTRTYHNRVFKTVIVKPVTRFDEGCLVVIQDFRKTTVTDDLFVIRLTRFVTFHEHNRIREIIVRFLQRVQPTTKPARFVNLAANKN